ncbi:hypothetical protein F5I97DRAFT_344770 [Phlebopus sp. FC_14]|nr:hypothetical protein F5I97DRAFT_344770 [Phlebopus sp. FC_14]
MWERYWSRCCYRRLWWNVDWILSSLVYMGPIRCCCHTCGKLQASADRKQGAERRVHHLKKNTIRSFPTTALLTDRSGNLPCTSIRSVLIVNVLRGL